MVFIPIANPLLNQYSAGLYFNNIGKLLHSTDTVILVQICSEFLLLNNQESTSYFLSKNKHLEISHKY